MMYGERKYEQVLFIFWKERHKKKKLLNGLLFNSIMQQHLAMLISWHRKTIRL